MFSCDQCGEAFTENHNLTRHKESKHAGVKYSCDQCDYTANRRDNLNRHKKKHRRIDADQADQPDPDLSHLSPEKEKTGGDIGEPQKVKCPHCSLSLASRGSLYKHIKLKHSSPSFLCHQCGHGFHRKDYLINHLKKHEKEQVWAGRVSKSVGQVWAGRVSKSVDRSFIPL